MAGIPSNLDPDEMNEAACDLNDRQGRLVVWLFFLLVALPPLAHHVALATGGEWNRTPLARLLSWRSPAGSMRDCLNVTEDSIDAVGYSTFIRRHVQGWLTGLGGEGNREVHVGGRDWLFSKTETAALYAWGPLKKKPFPQTLPQGTARHETAKDTVIEFAHHLRERGVPLLLVPVPVKPMIYPEFLSVKKFDAPVLHPDQASVYEQFRAAGIDVIDLTAEMWRLKLRKQVFFQQDRHWTPDAMKEMAEIVALLVRKKYPQALRPPDETPIVDARLLDRSSMGDLAGLLDVALPDRLFAREEATLVSIVGMDPSPASPVAVLGDSFVNVFDDPTLGFGPDDDSAPSRRLKAGFANQLAVLLNQPLDVIAVNQGGATAVLAELARRSEEAIRTKKLIIWVVACSDLLPAPHPAPGSGAK